jgi:hypothetical protein
VQKWRDILWKTGARKHNVVSGLGKHEPECENPILARSDLME